MANIASLHAKLLNIARQQSYDFQLFLNRFGAEQFLARLSKSQFKEKFIFKGGALLTYLIDTDRKTKDLDFTIKQLSNQVEDIKNIINSVLAISMDDGLEWKPLEGWPLKHPDMEHAGVRIMAPFLLGKMQGRIQMDMALGDIKQVSHTMLKRIRYKDSPLMGPDFSVYSYPSELIFAEKLQIAINKGEDNTRMRDFYDLFKLSKNELDLNLLKACLEVVFSKRQTQWAAAIDFNEKTITKLQNYWEGYIRKSNLSDAPQEIKEIISLINQKLKEMSLDGN